MTFNNDAENVGFGEGVHVETLGWYWNVYTHLNTILMCYWHEDRLGSNSRMSVCRNNWFQFDGSE